jgi:HAD superfamily hydrolase (TIGR01509 family)
MGVLETVEALNAQFGLSMDPHAVARDHSEGYARLLPELQPILSVVEFARGQRGTAMSVASGGDREVVEGALRVCGIDTWFQPVLCRQDVERGKPDPEMFLKCAELMGVPPEQCLVFEDGELGLVAARAAGMGWVAIDGSLRCSD